MPSLIISLFTLFFSLFHATAFAISSGSVIQANICGNLPSPTLNLDGVTTTDSVNFDIPGSTGSANINTVLYVNNQIADSAYSDNQGNFKFSEKLPVGYDQLFIKAYDSCGYTASSIQYSYNNNPKKANASNKGNTISLGFITQHLFPPTFPQAHSSKKDTHYYINSPGGNLYDALTTIVLWSIIGLSLCLLIFGLKKKIK